MVYSIINFIKSTDIFGQGIQLKINNQNTSKTFFGGLLTVLMFLLCASMFYYSAQDLMYQKNPQINIEQQILSEYPNITLNKQTLPISIFMSGDTNIAIPLDKYFKISVINLYGYTTNDRLSKKEFNLTLCKKENFPLLDEKTYHDLLINTYFCIENFIANLSGSWGDSYISFLVIKLSMCMNQTKTDNCASKTKIEEFLYSDQTRYLTIFFFNTAINPHNNTTPITNNILEFYRSAKLNSKKVQNIYIREESLDSDDDFIFENKKLNNTISYDSSFFDDQLMSQYDLIEFVFYSSNRKTIHHRKYMKIQTVLANVGGIANVLRIVFMIFSSVFSIVRRDEIMLNKIFEFDLNENNNEVKGNKQDEKQNIITINKNEYNSNQPKSINNYSSIPKRSFIDYTTFNQTPKLESNKKKKIFFPNLHKNLDPHVFTPKSKSNSNNISFNQSKNSSRIMIKEINNKQLVDNNPETFSMKTAQQIIDILNNKNKRYELRFSFYEIVRAFCCCKYFINPYLKSKTALYDNYKFVVDEYLDISYIIQKFEEFEKLKMVLFDNKQLALFHFIAKELISLSEAKTRNRVTQYKYFNKNIEQLVNTIVDFREKIIRNVEVKKIDKKLFNLLNPIFK